MAAVSEQTETFEEEIERAITANGLGDDALAPLLRAIGRGARTFSDAADRTAIVVRSIPEAASEAIAETVAASAGRKIADAVDSAAQYAARLHTAEAKRADRRWFWKAGLIAGLGALGLAVSAGAFCYWAGLGAGRSEAAATATDLRAAFGDGTTSATMWRDLVKYNGGSITQAMAMCEHLTAASGQPACKVALWTGPKP